MVTKILFWSVWELAEMIPYIRFAYFLLYIHPNFIHDCPVPTILIWRLSSWILNSASQFAHANVIHGYVQCHHKLSFNLKFKIPSKMSIELQYPKGGKRNDASCWWLISSVAGYCKIIDFYFKPFHQLQWLQWGQGERVANWCKLTKRIWRLFLFFDTCRQLSPQNNENTDDWW